MIALRHAANGTDGDHGSVLDHGLAVQLAGNAIPFLTRRDLPGRTDADVEPGESPPGRVEVLLVDGHQGEPVQNLSPLTLEPGTFDRPVEIQVLEPVQPPLETTPFDSAIPPPLRATPRSHQVRLIVGRQGEATEHLADGILSRIDTTICLLDTARTCDRLEALEGREQVESMSSDAGGKDHAMTSSTEEIHSRETDGVSAEQFAADIPATTDDTDLDPVAVALGHNWFQSFLLAGERYVVAGLSRPDTDEGRFAEFASSLTSEESMRLHGYFQRQAILTQNKRAALLGPLVDLDVRDRLVTTVTARRLLDTAAARSSLVRVVPNDGPVRANRDGLELLPRESLANPSPPDYASRVSLSLYLDSIEVNESQDDFWTPIGRKNKTDETSLMYVALSPTGFVTSGSMDTGEIYEGRSKDFHNTELVAFNLSQGGDHWPKACLVNLYAVERDGGGWNKFLEYAAAYAHDKVTKELIARGLENSPYPIPPPLSTWLGGVLKGWYDDFVDWVHSVLTDNDDVMGMRSKVATFKRETTIWNTGTPNSPRWDWTISGSDGRWTIRLHWHLAESSPVLDGP